VNPADVGRQRIRTLRVLIATADRDNDAYAAALAAAIGDRTATRFEQDLIGAAYRIGVDAHGSGANFRFYLRGLVADLEHALDQVGEPLEAP
jgi:hypothetical protein